MNMYRIYYTWDDGSTSSTLHYGTYESACREGDDYTQTGGSYRVEKVS